MSRSIEKPGASFGGAGLFFVSLNYAIALSALITANRTAAFWSP